MVVDIHGFKQNPKAPYRTPFDSIALLTAELEIFNDIITQKPMSLVITKQDGPGDKFDKSFERLLNDLENWEETLARRRLPIKPKRKIEFESIVAVSAKESILNRNDSDIFIETKIKLVVESLAQSVFL